MKKVFDRIGEIISSFSLSMIVVVILVSIIARGVFNYPLIWSGELSSMLIIWSIYSVFGTNYKEDKHFRIDIVDTFLSKRVVNVLNTIGDFLTLVALVFLIIYSFKAIQGNSSIRTAAMSVQVVYAFYLPFLLGCISFLVLIPLQMYKKYKS